MKRLPKKFVIMSPDYIQAHKSSLKIGGLTRGKNGKRIWYINETFAIYEYKGTCRKAGLIFAAAQKMGFIENVFRGQEYKPVSNQ